MSEKFWKIFSVISYLATVVLIFLGIDRINRYSKGEYSWEEERYAYVGGDAYNYIINANILTGYFVLASAAFLSGTISLVIITYINSQKTKHQSHENIEQTSSYTKVYSGESKLSKLSKEESPLMSDIKSEN